MKIRARPADETACAFYRIREPARVLAADGHDIELFDGKVFSHRQNPLGIWETHVPDVVVIQRPMARSTVEQAIPLCQAHGVAVVIEIDDDFRAIDSANAAFYNTHVRRNADYNANWLGKACAIADLVTCTTPALARRYGSHGRVAVIPNYIPAAWESIPSPVWDKPRVGWAGHLSTHPRDLSVLGHSLDVAIESGGGVFRAIGDDVQARLGIDDCRYESVDYVPMARYPFEVCALDVGLVPLVDSAFNRAKSALKATEYAALGVVPVMSPTPDNSRAQRDWGIGVLAPDARGWERWTADLLRDTVMRRELALAGRESVYRHATIERNAWRYLEAWDAAIANRRAATPHAKVIDDLPAQATASGLRPGRHAVALHSRHDSRRHTA